MSEATYWWERDDLHYEDNQLYFAGFQVAQLAERYSSPCFVYSGKRVTENLRRVKTALKHNGFTDKHRVYFAMKANRFTPMLTYLKTAQLCGIDACSPAEVMHALACGFKPEHISLTACSLSEQDFAIIRRIDGLVVNFDSQHAIRRWGELKPGSEIGIRINPAMGTSRADNDKLQYAGDRITKFGIYAEQFEETLALAAHYDLSVVRVHFHTGCGYLNEQLSQWKKILQESLWFIEKLPAVKFVNIGGGLGVPHTAEDKHLDLDLWAQTLASVMADKPWRIEVEPGDYIAKDAGLFLMEKTFEETKKDRCFVGVNAGFNLAPEPAYYALPFQPVALTNKAESRCVTVVGNINEALDVWYENIDLPLLDDQTHIALINAGGYSSSMASNHCMRGTVSEYLLI